MSVAKDQLVVTNQPLKHYSRAEYAELHAHGIFGRQRVELVFGQVVVMSPIGIPHIRSSKAVYDLLLGVLRGRAAVWAGKPFVIGDDSEPEPDVTVTARGAPDPREAPALLVIEVSESSLHYDRGEKALLYSLGDVLEYWIVDTVHDVLEVHRDRREGAWHDVRTHARSETVSPVAFPDVSVRVDDLFSFED